MGRCVERLSRTEQLARKISVDEVCSGASGSMEDEHRVGRSAVSPALQAAEKPVMDAQRGDAFAGRKLEVPDDVIGLGWRGIVACPGDIAKQADQHRRR